MNIIDESTYLARESAAQADPAVKETISAAYGKTETIPDDFDACSCVSRPHDLCFAETHVA